MRVSNWALLTASVMRFPLCSRVEVMSQVLRMQLTPTQPNVHVGARVIDRGEREREAEGVL